MSKVRARGLAALALLSGMGSVVYEVLYMRELTAVLGDMVYVHVALLAVFLLALGVGALLAPRALRWLFAVEAFIGLWAISFPLILGAWTAAPFATWISDPALYTWATVLAILGPPALAVGFSVPLFSMYIEGSDHVEQPFGLAYYAYNFGAAISILVVEFWVLRAFGQYAGLVGVACLNLLCAVVLVSRRNWVPQERPTPDWPPRNELIGLGLLSLASAFFHAFFLIVFYHLLLPFRENFALCTAAVLLGMAIGTELTRRTNLRFSHAAALGALAILLVALSAPFWQALHTNVVVFKFGVAFLFGGIPYIFLGAAIPALMRSRPAANSGVFLFVSGVANATGFIVYSFLLHPNSHVFFVVPIAITLLLLAAKIAEGRLPIPALGVLALGIVPLLYSEHLVYSLNSGLDATWESEIIKSNSDAVVLYKHPNGARAINYNGHPSIHAALPGGVYSSAERLSGMVSAPFAPSLERALVMGMGSGLTAGSAAQIYGHTDVVEINRAFWQVAQELSRGNYDLLKNPNATIHHDDARRYLLHTPHQYDVIINSIPSPEFSAAAKIYTLEFFVAVSRKLKPGGIYATWFSSWNMSPKGVDTLLSTLGEVFEYCQINILTNNYYFLNCSAAPLVRRPLGDLGLGPKRIAELERSLNVHDLELYMRTVDLSPNILRNHPKTELNTDSFPRLEHQIASFSHSAGFQAVFDPILTHSVEWGLRLQFSDDPGEARIQRDWLSRLHPKLLQRLE